MLTTTIAFFALAAILGVLLFSYVLKNKNTPKGLAITHGFVAAIAIFLLIIYTLSHTPRPIESLVLFIIAALGGFILVFKDLTGKSLPKWFVIVHGLIAVAGFIFLIAFSLLS